MKIKKLLVVLLAISMISSLVACGNSNKTNETGGNNSTVEDSNTGNDADTGAETGNDAAADAETKTGGLVPMADADDPITFKIFVRDPNTAPAADNPVIAKIRELTGVTIEYEFLVGDLDQKVGVMIAGEDYPDAIFAQSAKFIEAGAFIPIEDMLPNYPNLYAHYSPYADKMTAADGHQYILELYGVRKHGAPIFQNGGSGFYIQKAVLEDAGYVVPKTIDEYFELINNYRAKYPEIDGVKTIGFEILCDGWRNFCLLNPAQHLMGAGNDGGVYVDPTTYEASYFQIGESAKNYYKKLNEEFHKGTIEAETFTQNFDQYISRISTGAVLGFFDQYWNFRQGEDVLKTDEKWERTYISVPIADPGVQDGYLDDSSNSFTGNNGLGITKNCKNPERLMAFFDWLMDPEVQDYLAWGEEGKDWVKVGDVGKALTDERRAIMNDSAKKRDLTGDTLWQYSPKHQGLYDDGAPCSPDDSEDEFLARQSEYDQKFLEAYGIKYPAELLSDPVVRPNYYPVWAFTIEDGTPAKVADTKKGDITAKWYPALIICDTSDYDAQWDAFVAEFNNSNLQPYLDEVNKQIKEKMGL